jgi:hypothetical protein
MDPVIRRLREPPVKRVMEAVLSGSGFTREASEGCLRYCLDLGLVKKIDSAYKPANYIYADVILRAITSQFQNKFRKKLPDKLVGRFIGPDGPDISALLQSFQRFWARNIGATTIETAYRESDAQFSLLSYMIKAFNGSVSVVKEFATGSGRVDLCAQMGDRNYPIGLKLKSSDGYTQAKAVKQLLKYMDTCLAKEGWLVVFDRERKKPTNIIITPENN